MGMTAEERLAGLLDAKDEELREAREEIEELHGQLEIVRGGWTLHRTSEQDAHELPVPRLELGWKPDEGGGWRHYVVEYRLVARHLTGHTLVVPLGSTKVSSGISESPFGGPIANAIPYRDGAHIMHDAAHLRVPAYAITPSGPVRIDTLDGYDHARRAGAEHRRHAGAQ